MTPLEVIVVDFVAVVVHIVDVVVANVVVVVVVVVVNVVVVALFVVTDAKVEFLWWVGWGLQSHFHVQYVLIKDDPQYFCLSQSVFSENSLSALKYFT